jgi:hypothetical protein
MKKYQTHIIWGIIVVVALVGGYFWGKSTVSSARAGFAGATGTFSSSTRSRFGGAAGAGGGFTTGQITAVTPQSITLQLANGNSEVVLYSSSTAVTQPTAVSAANLAVGTNVMVAGTSNSDGSVTATTIQVRPATGTGAGGANGAAQ